VVGRPPIFGRPAIHGLHSTPIFHPLLHLASLMLTPLTRSFKSKANSFHPFPKFYLFIISSIDIFYFLLCNDEVSMLWKRSK
jgi:hypothetical protein